MTILNYTEDHHRFRERFEKFCKEELTPFVDQWEAEHIVPKSKWKQMGENGFLCTEVPKEYGGPGGDFLHSVIIAEELVKTEHMGIMAPLHSDIVVPYISTFGSEEIKHKYLPGCASGDCISAIAMTEPGAGSDVASMEMTAVEDGDDVVINGSKTFISNGVNCDIVIVAAKDPSISNPHKAISLYLIEDGTKGFEHDKKLEKMGMHSQDTAELFFTDCRIPKSNIIGEKGNGFIQLMQKLQQERLVCSIQAIAGVEHVLEKTVNYFRNSDAAVGSIKAEQAVQFELAEMTAESRILRAFIDQLILGHMNKENVIIETSIAKYRTSEALNSIINRCLGFSGDYGLSEKNTLVRMARDARVQTIYAGTNEVMKSIIAKSLGL
ncbi:acyl-CoA dehydrogenase family protein [bacterium]|nr:acyl-CoA dehydrogenase family protein [bacterium]